MPELLDELNEFFKDQLGASTMGAGAVLEAIKDSKVVQVEGFAPSEIYVKGKNYSKPIIGAQTAKKKQTPK